MDINKNVTVQWLKILQLIVVLEMQCVFLEV